MEFCSVVQERSDYVDASLGEGEEGLFVVLFLAVFPVVVGAGLGVVTGGCFGRGGAGAQQSAAVALGAGQVPADASGDSGDRREACDVGEPGGGFEHGEVVAVECEGLRGKQVPETGDAQEVFVLLVAIKPGLELTLDL